MGPPPLSVEELLPDRAELIASAMGQEGDLVAGRFARGCRCFAVLIDGAVAGYGWLSVGPEWVGELQLEIKPKAGEAYLWNCVTIPQHRMKGVFRSLLVGVSAVAHQAGLKRLWIGSVAIPGERAVASSGFKAALHFTTSNFAGVHWMRVMPATDNSLAAEACSVLTTRPGWFIRRSQTRRH
jgi:acetyltransferase (GNAT) family protein